MDVFVSRFEVEKAMLILKQFIEEHPKDEKADYAQMLLDRLEVLYMTW